jgi:hypothetical protein
MAVMPLCNYKELYIAVRFIAVPVAALYFISCSVDRSPNKTFSTKSRQDEQAISGNTLTSDEASANGASDGGGANASLGEMSDGGDETRGSATFDGAALRGDSSVDGAIGDGAVRVIKTKSGLKCGNITCAAVRDDVDQCCTTNDDVTAKRAQQAGKCGVDLRKRSGPSCLQREQPGAVYSSCPNATPSGALSQELGCCSAEGRCGTFNALDGIGCHYNKGPGETCSYIDAQITCERTGVFALRADVAVSWGGRTGGPMIDLTESGRGIIPVTLLATIDRVNDTGEFTSKLKVCSAELPPFYSALLCQSYQPVFPDAIWDSYHNLARAVTGQYECANPGCFLTFDPTTLAIGIELDDPDGPWPTADEAATFTCRDGKGVQCFPDDDGDRAPGVTVKMLTEGQAPQSQGCTSGYNYSAPPLAASIGAIFNGVRRTDRLFLGVRIRTGGSSLLNRQCGFDPGVGFADYIQCRAAGCMVQEGTYNLGSDFLPAGPNLACNEEETSFMNGNLPTYDVLAAGATPPQTDLVDNRPSEGSTFRAIRLGKLGETFNCKDVREAILK